MENISLRSRIIIEAAWPEKNYPSESEILQFYFEHEKEIREISASKIRFPSFYFKNQNAFYFRNRPMKNITIDEVVQVLPDIRIAKNIETDMTAGGYPFRSWHFTTHDLNCFQSIPSLNEMHDVNCTWLYVVHAEGIQDHIHGLIEFTFVRPEHFVRKFLKLKKDAHLQPVHGSFNLAIQYLDNQARFTKEYGIRPTHLIHVHGKKHSPDNCWIADAEGEDPMYTHIYNSQKRYSYLNSISINNNLHSYSDLNLAIKSAKIISLNYNKRYYIYDIKSVLHPHHISAPPSYKGEHVIIIRNSGCNIENSLTCFKWLKTIPEIILVSN